MSGWPCAPEAKITLFPACNIWRIKSVYENQTDQTPDNSGMGKQDVQRSDRSDGEPAENGDGNVNLSYSPAESPKTLELWPNIKKMLRNSLGESVVKLWIDPIQCRAVTDAKVVPVCPDRFFLAYVQEHFQTAIIAAASKTAGRPATEVKLSAQNDGKP